MTDLTEDFRQFVEGRFLSEFGLQFPNVPIEWDDQPFTQPKDGFWVKFSYMQNPAKVASIGRTFTARTTGFIQIDVVYHPEKNLKNSARKAAQFVLNCFSFQKFTGGRMTATFTDQHLTHVNSGGFGRWMGRVFFHYDGILTRDELKTIP